jgi:hypothetical protein
VIILVVWFGLVWFGARCGETSFSQLFHFRQIFFHFPLKIAPRRSGRRTVHYPISAMPVQPSLVQENPFPLQNPPSARKGESERPLWNVKQHRPHAQRGHSPPLL